MLESIADYDLGDTQLNCCLTVRGVKWLGLTLGMVIEGDLNLSPRHVIFCLFMWPSANQSVGAQLTD